jgi:dTDP-4-amino-4,6-dideoxygalactose transaminase
VSSTRRIYLSPPHLSGRELELVREAFESNWVAPLGPHVDAFEQEFAAAVGVPYAAALSSGTAALHLSLRILSGGTLRGAEVLCSTFTFAATANAIAYEGGVPVFIDCDSTSWNMDPGLLREELRVLAAAGKLPRAVIAVDLYGQCADYDQIVQACEEFGVPLIEDAAEALGATYWGRGTKDRPGRSETVLRPSSAGSFGAAAAFSFNGNKIITTSGGGMLVSHDRSLIERARFLATQAREPAPHYQHSEIGFNYRMSNVLAAIGRGQLTALTRRIAARRRNFEFYRSALGSLPGIEFMPEADFGRSTRWLTCLTIDAARFRATREDVRLALEMENIEARPVWKPMHLQPVFAGCRVKGGEVSERLFGTGLCLPSGSALTEVELERVCAVVRKVHETNTRPRVAPQPMSEKRPGRAVAGWERQRQRQEGRLKLRLRQRSQPQPSSLPLLPIGHSISRQEIPHQ